jgi:hypothetical protein
VYRPKANRNFGEKKSELSKGILLEISEIDIEHQQASFVLGGRSTGAFFRIFGWRFLSDFRRAIQPARFGYFCVMLMVSRAKPLPQSTSTYDSPRVFLPQPA